MRKVVKLQRFLKEDAQYKSKLSGKIDLLLICSKCCSNLDQESLSRFLDRPLSSAHDELSNRQLGGKPV